ncbi:hypothetical protein [uncultured Anaerococcus sp.]|nr:hypothetical protein [uncultured Anaerococcus sp.]
MGKDISSIGLDEEEVLYQRNSEFIVENMSQVRDIWYFYLREK